jgi:hypothetical protein
MTFVPSRQGQVLRFVLVIGRSPKPQIVPKGHMELLHTYVCTHVMPYFVSYI